MKFNRYSLLKYETDKMGRYLDLINILFKRELDEFSEFIEKQAEEISDEHKDDFYEYHGDEYGDLKEFFPQKSFSSFVVSWYSYIEQSLFDMCDDLKLTISQTIFDEQKTGRGIKRAKRFLYLGANYEINQIQWLELTHIRRIRNLLVHGGKYLPYSFSKPLNKSFVEEQLRGVKVFIKIEKNLHDYIKKQGILGEFGLYYISPTHDFGKHLIEFGKKFLGTIYSDLKLTD